MLKKVSFYINMDTKLVAKYSYSHRDYLPYISVIKWHSLTINNNRSKAKRTHFIHVYVKTNLPQHKKVELIAWFSEFWAL